jgi:hypothetical protein
MTPHNHPRWTAIHEAGHAVVALHLGIPFLDVVVREEDGLHTGQVRLWGNDTLSLRMAKRKIDWRDYVVFNLAGPVAQLRANDSTDDPDNFEYVTQDDYDWAEYLFDLFHGREGSDSQRHDRPLDCYPLPQPSDLAFTAEQAERETELLVTRLWDKIEAVASVLQRNGRLSYTQVRELT